MKIVWIVLGVVVILGLACGGSLMGSRNELVTEQESYKAAFQLIDVDMQRRYDLIPNLVETVKGFAAQEKSVLESIASARAQMAGAKTPAEKIAANDQIGGALARLLVVVENYPQLKSNENFQRLQDELAGTENRIAVARKRYNDSVQRYNTDIALFPKNIAASLFGFAREDAYFSAEAAAKQAPKVKF